MVGKRKLSLIIFIFFIFQPIFSQNQADFYPLKDRIASEENFLRGIYHYQNMEYIRAIEFFRNALVKMPTYERARFWLGKTYLMAGYKNLAIQEWEELVKLNSADILLRQKLQLLYTESFIDTKVPLENSLVFLRYLYGNKGITAIEIDEKNIFYTSSFFGAIDIFSPNFDKIDSITDSISKPMDISLDKNFLAVASFGNDRVLIFDKNTRKKIFEIGNFGIKEQQFAGPEGVFLWNQILYIADTANHRIQIFRLTEKNPQFLLVFGQKGREPGNFNRPTDVVFYKNKIYVSDMGNKRIQVFDESGNYLNQFGDDFLDTPRKLFIRNNLLYILDEKKGLLSYDFEEKKFSIIRSPGQDFQRPLGVCYDKNGVLYIADFFTEKISAFVPDKMKLSALKLDSLLTLNNGYPSIAIKLRIQDMYNKDIEGLNAKNFKLTQEGEAIKDFSIFPLKPEGKKLSLVILYRSSVSMKKYQKEIKEYLKKILENSKNLDRIAIFSYHENYKNIQPFTNQRLTLLDSLDKIEYSDSKVDSFDYALYQAITHNLNNEFYNAILILEDGKTKSSFNRYSVEVLSTYASKNGVPIFVVAFDEGDLTTPLKILAEKSGGEYFHFFKSNQIYQVFDIMRQKQPLFYILTYKSTKYHPVNRYHWLDVFIELNYKNLYGAEKTGFYIP